MASRHPPLHLLKEHGAAAFLVRAWQVRRLTVRAPSIRCRTSSRFFRDFLKERPGRVRAGACSILPFTTVCLSALRSSSVHFIIPLRFHTQRTLAHSLKRVAETKYGIMGCPFDLLSKSFRLFVSLRPKRTGGQSRRVPWSLIRPARRTSSSARRHTCPGVLR
jgi:hypothetical protein